MGAQQLLLQKFGDSLAAKYRAAVPKVTGRTAASIFARATDTEVDIRGAAYIFVVEYGRGPTRPGATKGEPTLFEAIKAWALAKGIIKNAESRASNAIVAAITRKIHANGTLLYRSGKPSGLLSNVTRDLNTSELLKELTILQVAEFNSEILRNLKQLQ